MLNGLRAWYYHDPMQTFDCRASAFKVKEPYDPSTYQYGQCYKVNLNAWTCDCGELQVEKFPCAYVFVACAKVSLDLS